MSIFCPELKKLLKPINYLTRKGRHFIWGEEQQTAFEEIRVDYKNPIGKVDCCYILTPANMPLVVLCIKFKIVSPNALHMLVKECQKQQRITPMQSWKCVVWLLTLLALHIC